MLDQNQTIEQRHDLGTRICLAAPDWLGNALFSLSKEITRGRRHHIRDGKIVNLDHPILNLIDEAIYTTEYLQKAAEAAGVTSKVDITKLYNLASDNDLLFLLQMLGVAHKLVYSPWPVWDCNRLVFTVWLKGIDADAVKAAAGSDIDTPTAWISDNRSIPINCTTPEMLRDLYNFPVREGGNIWALALNPEAIGKNVYNNANAALRRACERLRQRNLIIVREVQKDSLWTSAYDRSGIGLTENGVSVADELLSNSVSQAA